MKYYVYALRDPETREYRYVGLTRNPRRRLQEHCGPKTIRGPKTEVQHWAQEVRERGYKIEMVILEEIPYNRWPTQYELDWINFYTMLGCRLFNYQARIP